ncbi:hypothetical protein CI109_103163 [Kwoniella shandongensis]|uniref:Cation/H+ exchanger transmembrane domain-containing protein n=1 Tax=Kwoniella shandongensis TaxID=1734106 RepID=A0AAJ8LJ06_9TREE
MTAFHPFEVTAAHLAYTFLGGFVVIFGMLSLFLKERLYIGEAPIATALGIIIGPHCLKLFNPGKWAGGDETVVDDITLEVTRVVIAISVFAVGVELPKAYMKRHWRSLFFLLGPCMIWGWMVSSLLIWGLVPGLNWLAALVVAAPVTPTDPILAQAVIGGSFADKHVPAHVRHLLSAESGSNDGAAFPFLYIALYLLLDASPGHAVGEWFYMTWLYEIVLGTIIGALLGFSARKLMKLAEKKRLIDRQSYVAQYVSLAVLSIGITSLLGSDDLLSAFACGCAFAWDGFFNKATEDAVFSNVIDLLFNCAAFIYIGAIIPFDGFNTPDLRVWRLVVLAILILLLRRLPVIIFCYKWIPDIKTFREAAFTGWFGPMGVGAIFISTLARVSLPEGHAEHNTELVDRVREVIGPITAFLVLSSVVTHGMSIPFFSLGRRVHSITYTRSRQLSMDARGDEPAWTTHARRIQPGQEITINRDDDPEEGDLSIRRRDTYEGSAHGEKLVEEDSGGSSSSRTRHGDDIEMQEKRPAHGGDSDGGVHHGGEGNGGERGERRSSHSGSERAEEQEGDEEIDDQKGGNKTPPVAEFREGHHLIIERKRKGSEEVEVEVIRNHFHDDIPSEREVFNHPHRLKHRELDRMLGMLPKSLEHATSHVRDDGKHAIDRLGLGLMDPHPEDDEVSVTSEPNEQEEGQADNANDNDNDNDNDYEDVPSDNEAGSGSRLGRLSSNIPGIHISKGGNKKRSMRARLFGRRKNSSNSPSRAEEGRSESNPHLLAPPSRTSSRPIPIVAEPEQMSPSENRGIPLTRTLSASRSPAIRFAPDSQPSSDTAPGIGNYGANAPGFKRNPNLSMYRSASIQSSHSNKGEGGPSVSFKEPERKR